MWCVSYMLMIIKVILGDGHLIGYSVTMLSDAGRDRTWNARLLR